VIQGELSRMCGNNVDSLLKDMGKNMKKNMTSIGKVLIGSI
jgi:hypothetical protein